jgi:hypothetical protein
MIKPSQRELQRQRNVKSPAPKLAALRLELRRKIFSGSQTKVLSRILTAILTLSAMPLAAETALNQKIVGSNVEGTVVGITEKGAMIVSDTNLSAEQMEQFTFRQWALEISPRNMELLSFGREVYCRVYYISGQEIVGDCTVVVSSATLLAPKAHYQGRLSNSYSILLVSHDHELGKAGCTEEDIENLPRFPKLKYIGDIKCPEINKAQEE